jgi:uncharacterized protein (TIGR03437 family)
MNMIVRLLLPLLLGVSLIAAETPPSGTVLNAASLQPGPLAPGALAIFTGNDLSDSTESAPEGGDQSLPTKLGGVQVFFYGAELPLLSVSPTQVEFQLPYSVETLSSGMLYVRTEHASGRTTVSKGALVQIEPAAPGLFAFGGPEPRAGLILHSQSGTSTESGAPVTTANPAHAGETLIVWAAGLGKVEPGDMAAGVKAGTPLSGADAPVTNFVEAVVDGRSVPVIAAVLPQGGVGVYEVRFQVPDDLPSDSKAQLSIVQNGSVSNTVVFPLQNSNH